MRETYTRYPRSILWLVPGGKLVLHGTEGGPSSGRCVEVDPFYLSKWPITNEQFEAFDPGFERSLHARGDRDTAVGVTWEEAAAYCRWYAEVSRKPMRLPSEVEWEYACRGGCSGRYFWGESLDEADTYLWHRDNSDNRVQPPERKKSNGFGLYGMLGGVWEWTSSPWADLASRSSGGAATTERVLRGGSFRLHRSEISCSLRRAGAADARIDDVGFRIAKSLR